MVSAEDWGAYSRHLSQPASHAPSGLAHHERALWRLRFREGASRSETEYFALCNTIHYNPVKPGLATCSHVWPSSSLARLVRDGAYDERWNCVCAGTAPRVSLVDFSAIVGE